MNGNLVESMIGAVVLFVAAGFLYVAYTTTNIAGGGGYPLSARFDRVGALSLGADVRLGGIKVGTVTKQRLDPETFQAVVDFTVDPSIRLPLDSSASVTADGLLGESYLKIAPGGIWPGEEPEYLQPGDQVQFTEDPIDIFSLISKAVFSGTGEEEAKDGAEGK